MNAVTVKKASIVSVLIVGFILFALSNPNNSSFWPSKPISDSNSIVKDSSGENNHDYDKTTMTLIVVWVLLMILGSYLLIHIHFKVLKEERR